MGKGNYYELKKLLGFNSIEEKRISVTKHLLESGAYSIQDIKHVTGAEAPYGILNSLKEKGFRISSYWVEEDKGVRYKKYFISGKISGKNGR